MQTRHDPLPCGVRHWEILTDQNSSFKTAAEPTCTGLHSRMFFDFTLPNGLIVQPEMSMRAVVILE
jgi:hypothetical protein